MNDKPFPDLMALIESGMLAQATVRVQARQMLALESVAETLTKIEASAGKSSGIPDGEPRAGYVAGTHEDSGHANRIRYDFRRRNAAAQAQAQAQAQAEAAQTPMGPATDPRVEEPGAASRRRRRGGDLG